MIKKLLKLRSGGAIVTFSMVILGLFIILAIAGPLLTVKDPNAQDLMNRLKPPFWLQGSVHGHALGTDDLGRDILSRLIAGARVSIMVGVLAACLSGVLGTVIGLLSGFYKAIDQIMMRLADIQLAFPTILLALAIVAVLGGGMDNLVFVLGVTGWVSYARVVRSQVLSIRGSDFVVAAQTIGASDLRVLYRHILPNVYAPVITIGAFQIASAIIAESSLSFLGLGVPIDIPSWGNMLSGGQLYMTSAWWISVLPGLCILLVVLSINIIGDALRDYLDPKSRLG
ncbi:ABC transporter permease [Paenibacillus humicola]|uniref:ABC transporter permease n=1 Tax=Paenibacillus humicola TaxID=3110540 RepID=UPI00237A2229|nr:ABC transporter permease [Paenibacillus humicola]